MDTAQLIQVAMVVVGGLLAALVRELTKKIDKMDARIENLFTVQSALQASVASLGARVTNLEKRGE